MTSSESPYQMSHQSGCCVIALDPQLNDAQWGDIAGLGNQIVEDLRSRNKPDLIVDLTELSYMGSAMVALIVRLWKAVNETEGQMVVVNRHEVVQEVLKIAGLNKIWPIVQTREEGLKKLGVGRTALSKSMPTLLTVLALLAAIVATALVFRLPLGINPLLTPLGINPLLTSILQFCLAGFGLIVGLIGTIRGEGVGRVLNVLAMLASQAVIGIGIVKIMGIAN